jgi:hypothetical protein
VQINTLIEEECILKSKNKLCPYKKLAVFYNSCLKSFRLHLVCIYGKFHVEYFFSCTQKVQYVTLFSAERSITGLMHVDVLDGLLVSVQFWH